MITQARDFLDESNALLAIVSPLSDAQLESRTAFKDWSINDVLRHLHHVNKLAILALQDKPLFLLERDAMAVHRKEGGDLIGYARKWLDGLAGAELIAQWHKDFQRTAQVFEKADPSERLPWFGPEMGARSAITARLMETWAHGQEIYDVLGIVRNNEDRIENIATLGCKTYNWTFVNQGLTPPEPKPFVELTAPSGAVWTYHSPVKGESITGSAEEFCQVVTQVRNIADTSLRVKGRNATEWMATAQCFAGPPSTPPAPGARFTATVKGAPQVSTGERV